MESINLVKGYGKVNPSEHPSSFPPTPTAAAHKRRLTIALSLTLFLTLLICALVGAFIHAPAPPPSVPSNSADSLKIVCAVTQHPGSCFDSISSLNRSTGSKPDPEQFLNLSLQATVKELTNVSSLPKTLISKVNDQGTVSALKDCISLFNDALSQLNESAELLNVVGPGESALTEMKVKNMQTWISAAMTDQDTCLEGLDEMGSPLLGEVKARVQNAKEYMSNTLAILSNMPTLLQKFGITMH